MPKPKSTTSRNFVCHGRLHRNTNAPAVLADRRVSAGILFDATLDQLECQRFHLRFSINGTENPTSVRPFCPSLQYLEFGAECGSRIRGSARRP